MLKILLNRLKPQAEWIIAEEQAGFRAGRSTTEQIFNLRRHLLDNLDDKPADETERAPMKNKISFCYCFFILSYRASPVSGSLHRLVIVQQTF